MTDGRWTQLLHYYMHWCNAIKNTIKIDRLNMLQFRPADVSHFHIHDCVQ